MFFDPIYLIIVIVGMALSGGAALLVRAQFARGRRVPLSNHLTGRQVAEAILRDADIVDVSIVEHHGMLSDHYHPATKTLALSSDVFHGTDAAAAGVAAHEVGHAVQHARGYAPLWMRSLLVPVANIGSMLGPYIVIAGILMGAAQQAMAGIHGAGYWVAVSGVALFAMAALFTLITVPVEFDASSRAKERLSALGLVRAGTETDAVRGVLTAAGLTYVAAAANSLMLLAYWAWQAGLLGGRRND